MRSESLLTNKKTWVIVADESAATVYSRASRHGPLTELFSLTNATGRKKYGDLLSDRGGRSFDSFGKGRHTMVKEKSGPKKAASAAFAKDIANRTKKAMREGTCNEVALISPPRFLGVLRDALAKAGNVVPAVTIDKEMVGKDAAAIDELLARP